MPEEHLKCPKCGHEFDYYFNVAYPLTSLNISQYFRAQCPSCHRYSIYHTGIQIRNPAAYRTMMIISLLLVLAGIAASLYFLFSSDIAYTPLGISAIIAGLLISYAVDIQIRRKK